MSLSKNDTTSKNLTTKTYGFLEVRQELNNMNATYIFKGKEENWNICLERLRHFGITLVLRAICDNLKIIRCNVKSFAENVKPPHNLFSWDLDDFLKRVQNPDYEYITEFQQKHKKVVNFVKLQKDIESIIDLLNTFIADITSHHDLTRFENKLGTVFKFAKLQYNIFLEKELNEGISKTLNYKLKNFPKHEEEKINECQSYTQNLREQWQDNRLIIFPLKLRYIASWGNAQISQLEKEKAVLNETYLSQIRDTKFKYLREQECFSNIQEAYEGEISNFHKKIQSWQETYDKDYELRDLELTRRRAELDAIMIKLTKYHTQYETYDNKINKRLAQIAAEEADRAWTKELIGRKKAQIEMGALKEQEDEAAAAATKKAKKGKDKKGKDKKGKDKKGKDKKK